MEYQPKTGAKCSCRPGVHRDNCPNCEGTGWVIDFKAIQARVDELENWVEAVAQDVEDMESGPESYDALRARLLFLQNKARTILRDIEGS
jgi:hypothetical protein